MRAAVAVALAAALAGCGFPLDCTPRLAMVAWTQPGLFDALDPARVSGVSIVEELLAEGIPFAAAADAGLPRAELRELYWSDPPLGLDEDAERKPQTIQGNAYRPAGSTSTMLSLGGIGSAPSRESVMKFLETVLDAPETARMQVADDLMRETGEGGTMRSYQTTTTHRLRADAWFEELRAEHGEPVVEEYGRAVHLRFPGARFALDLPARIATFPNDSTGITTTKADDGLPYFRLIVTPTGAATLLHGEGNSRFDATEAEVMGWANESFGRAGLPAPTFDAWRADYATCI